MSNKVEYTEEFHEVIEFINNTSFTKVIVEGQPEIYKVWVCENGHSKVWNYKEKEPARSKFDELTISHK